MTKVSHFVLVHGIGGGSWCWYKVRCQLENSGYKVSCIDLKGAGINQSDAKNIHTFDEYNKPLIDFMSSLPDDEKVIVVGHSAGGLSLTDATHKFGKKISLAIYLGATMLKTGMCNEQDIKDGVPNLSEFGDAYDYGYGYGPDKPPTSALLKKEFHRDLIYQLSPPEDATLGGMLLRQGPHKALVSARFNEGPDVDEVPRVYIKMTQDLVLKLEQQEAMVDRWPPAEVYVLESDHSPYFSAPSQLVDLLVKAASSVAV
ncbi:methylesterase 17-like isoform X2 [Rhododendron vialii]|uniref:methylesterase 17-like isoform X2 n=1 Tax=Rhododendron vialii TaxID=182163 RepID=UPI00265DAA68|nr:methylesterase 17-like isoform X2 [Rhododendron vialii]